MDLYLFNQINQFVGKYVWLDILAIFLADYFGYVLILFLLLIVLFKSYWKVLFESLIASFVSRFVITELIYWIWSKPRPFVNNTVNLLLEHPDTAAFPSGHAAFYFALSSVIFFKNKKLGSLFLLGAFLISISRVFVGIHWPADILAGALIGIFSGWLITKFADKSI